MSSDKIKAALVAAHPTTVESQWKRRSKAKVAGGTERVFENAAHSLTVTTVESPSGDITVDGRMHIPATGPVEVSKGTGLGPLVSLEEGRARLDALVEEQATTKAPPKAATTPLRNQMVLKSRWKITQDATLHMLVSNPEIDRLCAQRDAISRSGNSQHRQGNAIVVVLGGGVPNTPAEKATIEAIQKQINAAPRKITVDKYAITAGTVIEIAGKIAPGYKSYDQKETDGLLVPVSVVSGSITNLAPSRWEGRTELPLNQIANIIEPLEIPETLVYVLRDTATGLFFGGWETETHHRYGYESKQQTNVPKMVPKFSSAKKYATNSAVKASIRDFTGYTSSLDHDADSAGDWYGEYSGKGKKMDLPPMWEMVSFDKPTATEKETFDVQDWFKDLMRLRVLTKGHGSAVRAAYKKAEGVEGMEVIIVFQTRSRGSYTDRNGKLHQYDEAETFEDQPDEGKAVLAAIKEAAEAMSAKSIRVKTPSSIAYACKFVDAFAAKLALGDEADLDVKVLDINTLEEVVENQEVAQ